MANKKRPTEAWLKRHPEHPLNYTYESKYITKQFKKDGKKDKKWYDTYPDGKVTSLVRYARWFRRRSRLTSY